MTYYLSLFFCLLLPLQFALNPVESVDLAIGRIIVIALFFIWLIASLKQKELFIPNKKQTICLLSFLFLSAFSYFASSNPEWGQRKLMFLLSLSPIYFIFSDLIYKKGEKFVFQAVNLLIISVTVVCFLGLFQFSLQFPIGLSNAFDLWSENVTPIFLGQAFSEAVVENPSWFVGVSGIDFFRVVSSFPDPHMLSFYLGLILPWPLALYLFGKKWRHLYLLLFILFLVTDLLTFSRGGYLGLFVGTIVSLLIAWGTFSTKAKRNLSIFFILIILLVSLTNNPVKERFVSSFDVYEGSNQGRIETWITALLIIKDYPFTGVGLGNYAFEVKPSAEYREPIYAHSIYLDIAAESGIMASLFWILMILSSILSFYKLAKHNPIYWAGIISLIIYSVHAIFETPLYSVRVFPLLLIILAISCFNLKELKKRY